MSDQTPELSQNMKMLSEAIKNHDGKVRTALFGFDLWLEVMGSGHTSMRDFRAGGEFADGTESETTVVVPVLVIGGRIVVGFDPTLPPDGFLLKS